IFLGLLKGDIKLLLKKNIYNILEHFFLSTHIPIQAFKVNGTLIHRTGFNDKLISIFDNNRIHCKVKTQLQKDKDKFPINIHCQNNIYFTSYYFYIKNKTEVIFLLGPHSSSKDNDIDIVYKPIY